jgi:hypothetical protein
MAGKKSSELKGYEKMSRQLTNLMKGMTNEGASALFAEAQIEKTESMKRTPVDTGNLKASHLVMPPVIRNNVDVSVTIAVGGPAAPYAMPVHENLDADHKSGQAKFLESTLKESAPYIAKRVARRIDLRRALEGK